MSEPYEMCQPAPRCNQLATLSTEERALLWCMRMWVIGLKGGSVEETRINDVLDTLGIIRSASAPLKSFMFALSQGCIRMINVQCICRERINTDEHALLDVLALAQALRRFEAMLMLRNLVTQAGAEAALDSAEAIGSALTEAGRFLPEPSEQARQGVSYDAANLRPRGLPTLH